jgi:hypothetical protein
MAPSHPYPKKLSLAIPARRYSSSRAHFLQHFRPLSDADFTEEGFAQQEHQRARLADAAADGKRQLVVDDRLEIGKRRLSSRPDISS